MKDPFLPVLVPRLLAAICVFLLIGSIALAGLLSISFLGPALAHGTRVKHVAGQVVAINPGKSFVLLTAMGQRLPFQCGTNCRASFGHLQRHLDEHAHTDVYYIEGPNRTLMAVDVD